MIDLPPSAEDRTPTPRRIMIVLHDLAAGGTERVALALADTWQDAGCHVLLFCGDPRGPMTVHVPADVPIHSPEPPIPRGRGSRRRLGIALADAIEAERPDVVFAPGNFHIPVLAAARRRIRGQRPLFVAKLSNPLQRRDRGPVRTTAFVAGLRWRARAIDGLVALCPTLAAEARSLLRHPRVSVIPDPIVSPPISGGARSGPPVILFIGRLARQKRPELALQAFAGLPAPARLRMLGDGPERASLEAVARDLRIAERVDFMGQVDTVAPALGQADLLLSTSLYEGVPAAITEAVAAGVPVVATRSSPSLDRLLANGRGTIVDDAPDTLARTMATILAGPRPDPHTAREFYASRQPGPTGKAWLQLIDRLGAGVTE